MNFNRRFVLIALGTAAIATGLVFGSGAFTTVEADRTVNVDVAGDNAAFLQLESIDSNYTNTVSGGAGANVLEIELASVNDDAVTVIDGVINVTNQGTQEVNVTLDDSTSEGVALTGTPVVLGVGDSAEIGVEVAVGDAPRTVNGGYLNTSTSVTENVVINATAT